MSSDSLQSKFSAACDAIRNEAAGPLPRADLLNLYGLFSVVMKGCAPDSGPSPFLDPQGNAKWQAWVGKSNLSRYVGAAHRLFLLKLESYCF